MPSVVFCIQQFIIKNVGRRNFRRPMSLLIAPNLSKRCGYFGKGIRVELVN